VLAALALVVFGAYDSYPFRPIFSNLHKLGMEKDTINEHEMNLIDIFMDES